jgi:hypothetical protein
MSAAYLIVLAYSAAVITAAWFVFHRTPPRRPWIGVINILDVALLFGALVVCPYLYLIDPAWVTTILLALVTAIVSYRVLARLTRSRLLAGAVTAAILVAEIGTAALVPDRSNTLLLVNGALLAPLIVGAASLLVKGGLLARDVAVLAGGLAIYDFLARSQLTLIDQLIERASGLPFLPLFGWWHEADYLVIGAADLVVAAVFPLAARKAFGKTAGLIALGASLASIAIALPLSNDNVPAMMALGPLVVAQYFWWIRRRGREQTTWEYLGQESPPGSAESEQTSVAEQLGATATFPQS